MKYKGKCRLLPAQRSSRGRALFTILAAGLIWTSVDAADLKRQQVEDMVQQCEAAETPIFNRIREDEIEKCQRREKKNRGDPSRCAKRNWDIRPGGSVVLSPQLPICDKAFKARKHFRLDPN